MGRAEQMRFKGTEKKPNGRGGMSKDERTSTLTFRDVARGRVANVILGKGDGDGSCTLRTRGKKAIKRLRARPHPGKGDNRST